MLKGLVRDGDAPTADVYTGDRDTDRSCPRTHRADHAVAVDCEHTCIATSPVGGVGGCQQIRGTRLGKLHRNCGLFRAGKDYDRPGCQAGRRRRQIGYYNIRASRHAG